MKTKATTPRFDWYSGSFDSSESAVEALETLTDESPRQCRPRNGYDKAYELRNEGCTVARVMSGERFDWAYFEASGEDAHIVANLLRLEKVPHTVARADACADVNSKTAYTRFETALLTQLPDHIIRTNYSQTKNGRTASTLYLGSRKSEAFARVYEKGKESPETHAADTVRIEVQARPHGAARKVWAAKASPLQIMSVPRWSETLLSLVDLDRLPPPKRTERMSDLEGALTFMGSQYRRRVAELVELHQGDLDAVWTDLRRYFMIAG